MMSKLLEDVNGKTSFTRKQLQNYSKIILLFDALIILMSMALKEDIGSNASFIVVSVNSVFFGSSYIKMGMEFLSKRK